MDLQNIINMGFLDQIPLIKPILAWLGASYVLALAVVKATPTKADDEFLEKIYNKVHGIIAIFGVKK